MDARRLIPCPTVLRTAAFMAALVTANAWGPLASAQPADPEPAAPNASNSATNLAQLNDGIAKYLQQQYGEARAALEDLRSRDPQNIACLYYLGLIYLSDGLQNSGLPTPEAAELAREAFMRARDCFQTLVTTTDPGLRPIEAALDLSIAQLASEDRNRKEEAMQLAESAAKTLQDYIKTPTGSADRLGRFYLGIAYYRLASERRGNYLRQAADAFSKARSLGEADHARSEINDTEFAQFQTRVRYYQGLIALIGDRQEEARENLEHVSKAEPGKELSRNADQLLTAIQERQENSPAPLSLDSPIGPLRVEGYAGMGHYYDDNLILLGHDTSLPRGISQQYDYRFGLQGGFDVTRLLTNRDGILGESFLIGVGASTTHFWQPSVKEFDINSYDGRAYLKWEPVGDFFLGLQYDYGYTMLGHEGFISSNRITPVVSKVWRDAPNGNNRYGDERARTDLYYSFDYRNYLDELTDPRFDRDGKYHAVGVTQNFNLWKADQLWAGYYGKSGADGKRIDGKDADRWMTFKLGYAYRDERTQGDEFDLWGHTLLTGVSVPLPWRLVFEVNAEFSWDEYNQPSLLDFRGMERSDFIQRYDFGLTRTLIGRGEYRPMPTLEITARGGVEISYHDSNIWNRLGEDVYSFNRAIYGLTVSISF